MNASARERMTVLVVDDEYLVRYGLRTTIDWERHGLELVGEAEDGEAGLELAVKHRPDIIVTDMSMPFLDGIGLMEQVRARGIGSKIIVLSGYDDFQYAKGAITHGASDYMLKPVENDHFISVVNRLADSIRRERLSEKIVRQKLIGDLAALLRTLRNRKTAGNVKVVDQAIRYIQAHYAEDLSVKRIADRLYVSPSYLMHAFKESTSETVNDYITSCRILKAKELLRTGRYRTYEVCELVGIRDPRFSASCSRSTRASRPATSSRARSTTEWGSGLVQAGRDESPNPDLLAASDLLLPLLDVDPASFAHGGTENYRELHVQLRHHQSGENGVEPRIPVQPGSHAVRPLAQLGGHLSVLRGIPRGRG
ncbi:response regulator [Cohnella xylanilytica]|uniref:Response regulator n=1 Tax=Cohnella xylanilytica TaxID=557555 RepID=A0A841TTH4_9BACL|nr:response regulator [Cohnella xylanilytica]MBB6690989.1 response regulator [Cohnella xylanilytica]